MSLSHEEAGSPAANAIIIAIIAMAVALVSARLLSQVRRSKMGQFPFQVLTVGRIIVSFRAISTLSAIAIVGVVPAGRRTATLALAG